LSRVVRYHRYGGPEVLAVDEVPTPDPAQGQVRVSVRAAGVNAIDWKRRRGLVAGDRTLSKPEGTGVEMSGTIDAVGPGVEGWSPGQDIVGRVASGAAATEVMAKPENLVIKPSWLPFDRAAVLPVAVETSYRTLGLLNLQPGQTLLIHAAAGGVGLTASQLAIARGVEVIGTASPRHHDFLRKLGVKPVEYGDGLVERVRAIAPDGVDAVLDASGRGALPDSIELAGGADKVLTIADPRAAEYGVRFSGGGGGLPLPEVFAAVLPLIERGTLDVPIEASFPLERTADAQRLSEAGHVRGKLVITVP
jgi:NADPH:quinone reductase-like Zn-dependent oxidoreductase